MPWRKGNKLPVIAEEQAEGHTREIYDEIKGALGVPHVTVLHQAYGVYPEFLELHWRALRPVVESEEFLQLAGRIRADAYTRIHNYFEVPDLGARIEQLKLEDGARQELMESTELFHYNASVILLVAAIQMRTFDTAIGRDREGTTPAQHPTFYYSPLALDEDTAPAATRRIFDEMRRGLGIPFLNVAYRVYARWPGFLAGYWKVLREIIQSPVYIESQHGVRDTAWAVAAEIPRRVELTIPQLLDAGIKDDDLGAIVRMTELFVKSLSALTLNVSVAKIGLEGGSARIGETQRQASQPGRAA